MKTKPEVLLLYALLLATVGINIYGFFSKPKFSEEQATLYPSDSITTIAEAPVERPELSPKPFFPKAAVPFTTVVVDVAEGLTWQHHHGSTIMIPADAFVSNTGMTVTGQVNVYYREFRDAVEMMASGIAMDDRELMIAFEIHAEQNGIPLQFREDRPAQVNYLSRNFYTYKDFPAYRAYWLDSRESVWKQRDAAPVSSHSFMLDQSLCPENMQLMQDIYWKTPLLEPQLRGWIFEQPWSNCELLQKDHKYIIRGKTARTDSPAQQVLLSSLKNRKAQQLIRATQDSIVLTLEAEPVLPQGLSLEAAYQAFQAAQKDTGYLAEEELLPLSYIQGSVEHHLADVCRSALFITSDFKIAQTGVWCYAGIKAKNTDGKEISAGKTPDVLPAFFVIDRKKMSCKFFSQKELHNFNITEKDKIIGEIDPENNIRYTLSPSGSLQSTPSRTTADEISMDMLREEMNLPQSWIYDKVIEESNNHSPKKLHFSVGKTVKKAL